MRTAIRLTWGGGDSEIMPDDGDATPERAEAIRLAADADWADWIPREQIVLDLRQQLIDAGWLCGSSMPQAEAHRAEGQRLAREARELMAQLGLSLEDVRIPAGE